VLESGQEQGAKSPCSESIGSLYAFTSGGSNADLDSSLCREWRLIVTGGPHARVCRARPRRRSCAGNGNVRQGSRRHWHSATWIPLRYWCLESVVSLKRQSRSGGPNRHSLNLGVSAPIPGEGTTCSRSCGNCFQRQSWTVIHRGHGLSDSEVAQLLDRPRRFRPSDLGQLAPEQARSCRSWMSARGRECEFATEPVSCTSRQAPDFPKAAFGKHGEPRLTAMTSRSRLAIQGQEQTSSGRSSSARQ
jgi:hypothetical protein